MPFCGDVQASLFIYSLFFNLSRNLLKQGVAAHNFVETSYTDKSNRQSPCFNLTPKAEFADCFLSCKGDITIGELANKNILFRLAV